ncbi:hypothetical protein HDU87_003783 [Geranomyces variabilis]|uniref:MOCS2B n=1 Tax=Geranomyces variabilis TaxID=109894 RepID=A0AAD5XQY4_9FUNG|nr:hypothetical protein HDU87_003783 [Geranomyces variabilis]
MQTSVASSATSTNPTHHVELTTDPISLAALVDFVRSDEAGAIATFSGTTRNSFIVSGVRKSVTELSYEAYAPMAIAQFHTILNEAQTTHFPTVIKLAVAHRTGVVPVGQESVIIAASSPGRKDAQNATAWILDELKRRVPIWKKEHYGDGSVATWKENGECSWLAGGPH